MGILWKPQLLCSLPRTRCPCRSLPRSFNFNCGCFGPPFQAVTYAAGDQPGCVDNVRAAFDNLIGAARYAPPALYGTSPCPKITAASSLCVCDRVCVCVCVCVRVCVCVSRLCYGCECSRTVLPLERRNYLHIFTKAQSLCPLFHLPSLSRTEEGLETLTETFQ